MTFLNEHDLINLIKNNTSFKGEDSCIDLILTNRNSTSFETFDLFNAQDNVPLRGTKNANLS